MSIRREEHFNKKGEHHGQFKEYYIDNDGSEQLVTDGSYKNGKKNGEWRSYFININSEKKLSSFYNYKNDKQHGKNYSYSLDGTITQESEHYNNKVIYQKHYVHNRLASNCNRIGKNLFKVIEYHLNTDLIKRIYTMNNDCQNIGAKYEYYMYAGKITSIIKINYKKNRACGNILLVDDNHNEIKVVGFGMRGCVWEVKYLNSLVHIGCKSKSIEDWDKWFAGTEEYSHHRSTTEFKKIHETYLKVRKKAISFEKKLAQLK